MLRMGQRIEVLHPNSSDNDIENKCCSRKKPPPIKEKREARKEGGQYKDGATWCSGVVVEVQKWSRRPFKVSLLVSKLVD